MPDSSAYDDGRALGEMMKASRDVGDSSYDCRSDLTDAAKQGRDYFVNFRRGLDDGLRGETTDA